jgi:hypothetical protein
MRNKQDMCYHDPGSTPFRRSLLRGVWRTIAITSLLWLALAGDARAQQFDSFVPSLTVPAAR